MSWPGRPPSAEILLGTPQSWARLGREDAVRYCRMLPVAVVYSNFGYTQSAWFGPGSPFYMVDGPYDYGSLRYFAMASGGGSMIWGKGGGTSKRPKQGEAPVEEDPEGIPSEEFEPLEEAPVAPTPPKPAMPAAPSVPKPTLPTKPAIPKAPQVPQPPKLPERPEIPQVPDLPPNPQLPGLPQVPEVPQVPQVPQAPGLPPVPGLPATPALPEIPPLPAAAKKKIPVEIALVSSQGKPLADTAYTLVFPDGKKREGRSDAQGMIKAPDNEQEGEVELILPESNA